MNNFENYLYIAVRAALDAGKVIMDIYNDPESDFEIERKADNSPLTKADKKSHQVISLALSVTPFPVLSEEGRDIPYKERSKWDTFWLIDPLDGTKEFIKRNGEFTVNIALVKQGVPVLGVIYVPAREELYLAEESFGAYKMIEVNSNNMPPIGDFKKTAVSLPQMSGHQGLVVVASRSHMSEETLTYIEGLRKQGPVTLISSGSSLKICQVADGSADIYPRFAPTMEWDTAAGHAIARAAGCNVFHVDGKTPLKYNKEDLHNPWFIVKGAH